MDAFSSQFVVEAQAFLVVVLCRFCDSMFTRGVLNVHSDGLVMILIIIIYVYVCDVWNLPREKRFFRYIF